jgi:3-dehydroquinate synthase
VPERVSTIKTSRTDQYSIITEPGLLDDVGLKLRALVGDAKHALIVTDGNVKPLYADALERSLARAGFTSISEAGFAGEMFVIAPGELSKSLQSATKLWSRLAELGFRRRSILIGMGGGVVTDLTGFGAAGFMRGVPYVSVPTTLIAQDDAAVGSKVAVNLGGSKNLVGGFHHPLAVYNDTSVLRTLPPKEFRQGLAEAIKVAVIASPELFDFLETHLAALLDRRIETMTDLVSQTVKIKCELLKPDLYEKDLRRGLNFGHTIGHALEMAALEMATDFCQVLHGDAVSIGIAGATKLAETRKLLDGKTGTRIIRLLEDAGLPTTLGAQDVATERLRDALSAIRAVRNGHVYEVLPIAIGRYTIIDDLSDAELLDYVYS